jgi:hypothetical protein
VQGSDVSTVPHTEQMPMSRTATPMASDSGTSSWSFFLMRCKAARRADRGPSPGSFASNWISRSISGPATCFCAIVRPFSMCTGARLTCRFRGPFRSVAITALESRYGSLGSPRMTGHGAKAPDLALMVIPALSGDPLHLHEVSWKKALALPSGILRVDPGSRPE